MQKIMTDSAPNNLRFGPFVIHEKLGSGGMAAVYRAFDEESGQFVALKVLHATLAEQPEVIQRFQQEVDIVNRLRHAHVVAIHKHGIIKNRPYLVMQFMGGGTLAHHFEQPREITSQHAVRLMRHIGSALDYAHRQKVVHRDLKLENILLDNRGDAYLSDFGIARIIGGTRLTITGNVVGTPLYISPEQARGKLDLDYRSDLYSLAVIAYVLAVGRFPFDGNNVLAILNQHLSQPAPVPSEVNPTVPPALDNVLLKGLAKRPEDRYRSADAFIEAFALAAEGSVPHKTMIDIWTQHSSTRAEIEDTGPEIVSADDWYEAAISSQQPQQAIEFLKRALELDPLHSKANRLLMQLEKGAVDNLLAMKKQAMPVPTPHYEPELPPLKKAKTEQQRSVWNYIGFLGLILLIIIGIFIVITVLGVPIAQMLPRPR